MSASDVRVWLIIALITLIVVVFRNFFLFAPRSWQPRGLVQRALRYAPLAALAALIAPQVLADLQAQGQWGMPVLADAKFASALVLIAVIRLSGNPFAGMAAGTLVFVLLRTA